MLGPSGLYIVKLIRLKFLTPAEAGASIIDQSTSSPRPAFLSAETCPLEPN
jgi:hypothetical protein